MDNTRLIDLFIDSLKIERSAAKNTVLSYKNDIEHFAQHLYRKKPRVYLVSCSNLDIKEYIKYLNNQYYSSKSQSRKISALKQFYAFLEAEKLINEDPTVNISSPKVNKSLPKMLSPQEVVQLIEAATKHPNPMLYTMLELLYSCGMRVSELVALKLSSFVQNGSYVLIKGKGNKERIVPVSDIAQEALKRWLLERKKLIKNNKSLYLFPSVRAKSGYITRERFFQLLKELAIQCNIDYKKVSPHVIRHSFASHILNNGGDLVSIQHMLGHTNLTTTEIYTHVLNKKLQDAVFKHHPLNKISPNN